MFDSNINDKINAITKTIDTKDSYLAIYKELVKDEYERINTTLKLGLFKKENVLNLNDDCKISVYKDLLSDNTMGIRLDEDGNEILCSDNEIPSNLKNIKPISADNCIAPYSNMMFRLKVRYGLKDFSAMAIGVGLVNFEEFAPEYNGNISLSDLLKVLLEFDKKVFVSNIMLSSIKCQLTIMDNLKKTANELCERADNENRANSKSHNIKKLIKK